MRGVVCGAHDGARGVLVEAMHNARSRILLAKLRQFTAGDVLEAPGERVDQRARLVAARGMHDQARGLVDDDDRVVFVDHIEWDVLGLDRARWRRRKVGDNAVAFAELGRALGHAAVDGDRLFVDEPLNLRAREERHAVDEISIESLLEILQQFELDGDGRLVVFPRVFLVKSE